MGAQPLPDLPWSALIINKVAWTRGLDNPRLSRYFIPVWITIKKKPAFPTFSCSQLYSGLMTGAQHRSTRNHFGTRFAEFCLDQQPARSYGPTYAALCTVLATASHTRGDGLPNRGLYGGPLVADA
ncbi:MAG: hypothetical protein DRP74_08920 [Candidatus Omnitrophota bacterium]|nr:MAG: hypothetical protein DRP74_08920 [Candidatus Omnitrophota bacterium]